MNIATTNYITEIKIWYNSFTGVNELDIKTLDPAVVGKAGQRNAEDIQYYWSFTETNQLLGFFGQESPSKIANMGVITFDTTCDPQYVYTPPVTENPPEPQPVVQEVNPTVNVRVEP